MSWAMACLADLARVLGGLEYDGIVAQRRQEREGRGDQLGAEASFLAWLGDCVPSSGRAAHVGR